MTEQGGSNDPGTENVVVEHVRVGDVLSLSGADDPRTHVFRVAKVELRNKLSTGEQPRVILTSVSTGAGTPMVLDYPTGTRLRKIIGRPSG